MDMSYTYWVGESGWLVGYLDQYPEHWTQGKDLSELEEMLIDLYRNIKIEENKTIKEKKTGLLRIPA